MSAYPNLFNAAEVMAQCNDAASFTEEQFTEVLQDFDAEQIAATDAWLAKLSEEQLEIWCDGELDDIVQLAADTGAPEDAMGIMEELFDALCG